MTKCTNPNFETWSEQNGWEADIIEKLNELLKDRGWHFKQSTEFENKNRHTDAFLTDCNNNIFRIDFKTVKWNSHNDNGSYSNFVINDTNFPIKYENPIQCFCFIGKYAEYAYFVMADKILKDEIISVIYDCKYGEYEYFSHRKKSKYKDASDYILFSNEYIKNNSFYIIKDNK